MSEPQRSESSALRCFFIFFFVSGFCSILYEVVWLRLAMAKFGVTSALLSIVLSMFMAGLGLGSWLGGRFVKVQQSLSAGSALRLYAAAEFAIGASALLVPLELAKGRELIAQWSPASTIAYYSASCFCIGLTLVPWCAWMGATIPFAMAGIRGLIPEAADRSFSFLYLANVVGAFFGALVPLILIEAWGFHGTLKVASILNIALAVSALVVSAKARAHRSSIKKILNAPSIAAHRFGVLALLFATGCTSMGLEVVWTREFTPYVGTVVYAFSSLLALYLGSTFLGSRIYRRWSAKGHRVSPTVWALLGFSGLLAAVTADPAVHLPRLLRLVIGIVPFSGLLGFVTPMLVDRWSGGDPDRAGSAYAWNVVGCIVGPLLSGFLFLPFAGERWVLLIFASPWLAVSIIPRWSTRLDLCRRELAWERICSYVLAITAIISIFATRGYESRFSGAVVRRDPTATIIAMGTGLDKHLLVNGIGITKMTPITKMMAHLPLAFLDHPPENALAICFGMGTSYRSLLSWNIRTTAVELVPSVPKVFWYFHSDAQVLLNSPLSQVVIDDGRNYLERTKEQFDVITIDPPPPVEAAGSSLLYSKEFYATITRRLKPGGILQQWLPRADATVRASAARALQESFRYVRVFGSVEGWGLHFLASNQPIPERTPAQLTERLPATAVRDLIEWGPEPTAEANLAIVLSREQPVSQIVAEDPDALALVDDRPINEFYGLRRYIRPDLRLPRRRAEQENGPDKSRQTLAAR